MSDRSKEESFENMFLKTFIDNQSIIQRKKAKKK